jgi:putative hydrolase of the HAD superfamily
MKFRAILFDAAETLFTTRGSVGQIYATLARQHGSQADADAIQAAFVRHFRGAGPVAVRDEKRWWKDIVFHVFTDVGMVENFDEFFDRLYDNFRGAQGWMLFPETLHTLKQLKSLGLKLGVISNFDSRIYSVLDALGIRDFFDVITVSSEVGCAKPDQGIFDAAVGALGIPASAVLLVGDSPHDDVEPAIRAGLSAVLVDRNNRHPAKTHLRRITSLTEVIHEVSC